MPKRVAGVGKRARDAQPNDSRSVAGAYVQELTHFGNMTHRVYLYEGACERAENHRTREQQHRGHTPAFGHKHQGSRDQ